MTLEPLRIFLAVAERQHVTRAAEALHLTQSAVSASVAALEARHGVRLCDRVGRRIELTEAGRLFIPEAKAILDRAETAERVLADLGGQAIGQLRVHASQTVASYWLPQRLVRLHERHPRIAIVLAVGNTTQVARAVADGAADIGVVEGTVLLPELKKTTVGQDRMVLVIARDHPFAARQSVPVEAFAETPWILREVGSGTRAEFDDLLARHRRTVADLSIALELPSDEAILAAVATGASASVLSDLAVGPALATGRVMAIELDREPRRFVALTHRERYVTRAAEALLALLKAPETADG